MSDQSNRERVGAYLAEHPKASDGWIGAALDMEIRYVRRARRQLNGELANGDRLKKLRSERISWDEYNARRSAPLKARNEKILELLRSTPLQAADVAAALETSPEYARNLLIDLQEAGYITSYPVRRTHGHGKPWRFFRLPVASGERAA